MKVVKRDGREEDFDTRKILFAVSQAMGENGNLSESAKVAEEVESYLKDKEKDFVVVDQIHDAVERSLMKINPETAKRYILYRQRRNYNREASSPLNLAIGKSYHTINKDNANAANGSAASKMYSIAETAAKQYNLSHMPSRFAQNHRDGRIYIHDLGYRGVTFNCFFNPIGEMLEKGFDNGVGYIRPPKRIGSAVALVSIILQSSQNDLFGGQGVLNFDKDLRKYVGLELEYQRRMLGESFYKNDASLDPDVEDEIIMQRTDEAVYQAMEAFVYNCNTMRSRSGAQVTFSSVNFGTETDWQSRMISKNLLKAYIAGLGNGENPIFPNLCYRLKDGINLHEGEPNFDLTQLAIECVGKRIQPRFVFCDSPAYEGLETSQIGTMGCLAREEVIVYEYQGITYCEGIGRMTARLKKNLECQKDGLSLYMKPEGMKIWDRGVFVDVKTVIENPVQQLYHVAFSNGRDIYATLDHSFYVKGKGRIKLEELQIGDEILSDYSAPDIDVNKMEDEDYDKMFPCDVYDSGCFEYILGVITMGNIFEKKKVDVSSKDQDFISHLEYCIRESNCENVSVSLYSSGELVVSSEVAELIRQSEGTVPQFVFTSPCRIKFLAGAIDMCGTTANGKIRLRSKNRELLLQLAIIAQSLGMPVNIYPTQSKTIRSMEFCPSEKLLEYVSNKFKDKIYTPIRTPEYIKVVSVHADAYDSNVYDVETSTGHFSASLIQSGNCRTAIRSNVNGDKNPDARGNLAFNTINLPYIALETVEKHGQNIDAFFDNLDAAIEDAIDELLTRYDVISSLKPRDVPFVGQWYQNHEELRGSETIEPIVKNGTLSVGFIGLAECLIALTGKHHGESKESQELGLKIISRIREATDYASAMEGLNLSCFASPAESACFTLLKAIVKRFGVIPRISDKDYLTNSFHLPVSFECDAKTKVDIESPYHLLCNAGAIFYVEAGSSPESNPEGVLSLLQYIAKSGIVYGGINWTHSFCKVCHHQGSFEGKCPVCGCTRIKETKIITGYLSEKERFNDGKVAESEDRISHAG